MSLLRDRTSERSGREGDDEAETSGGECTGAGRDHAHTHKLEESRRLIYQPIEGAFK